MTLNLIFMGTPEFCLPTLESLINSEHQMKLVVTNPDKPKGRGKKMSPPPVKEFCLKRQIKVFQPDDLRDEMVYNRLKDLKPDLMITMAYGKIIPGELLKLPSICCINVHASLLPKYRGAAPIHWAVINGEKETGITIMLMDEGMDTGDILAQKIVSIEEDDTTGDVHDKLAREAPDLLIETISKLKQGKIAPLKQDDTKACLAPKLEDEHIKIDWNKEDAISVYNKIRGLNPWPGAYTFWKGKRIKLWSSEIYDRTRVISEPGELVKRVDGGPVVQCRIGLIKLTSLQLEGKKKISGEDFLKGYSLEEGDILRDISGV